MQQALSRALVVGGLILLAKPSNNPGPATKCHAALSPHSKGKDGHSCPPKMKLSADIRLTYLYPAKAFMKDDLPAPEGPMMAISSPGKKRPDRPFKMTLLPVAEEKKFSDSRHTHISIILPFFISTCIPLGLCTDQCPHPSTV